MPAGESREARGGSPWWLTFRQAKAVGGTVRAGERSTPVIFWRWIDRRGREVEGEDASAHDDGGCADRIPVLRYYSVFNLDQTEGIDPVKVPCAEDCAITEVPTAEEIVARFPDPPTIEHRAQPRAFYRPATDSVTMPLRAAFDRTEGYCSTLLHELTHATGHAKRLARPSFDKNHAARQGLDADRMLAVLGGAAALRIRSAAAARREATVGAPVAAALVPGPESPGAGGGARRRTRRHRGGPLDELEAGLYASPRHLKQREVDARVAALAGPAERPAGEPLLD